MGKAKVATVWLDGCSGCHMSFLDIDERLLAVADKIELVYSPLVDVKEYPDGVDVAIIEGAVSSEEDYHKLKNIRSKTKILVALGDCAVNSNVPSMRNQYRRIDILKRAYEENVSTGPRIPDEIIPTLREKALPLHAVVKVDMFIPGCPPHADTIFEAVVNLLGGDLNKPLTTIRFG